MLPDTLTTELTNEILSLIKKRWSPKSLNEFGYKNRLGQSFFQTK